MSIDDNVIVPQVRKALAYHATDGWPEAYEDRLWWLGAELREGADLFVTTRSVVGLRPDPDELVDLHEHPVPQLYLIMGNPVFSVDLTIGEERRRVDSPATIYIPAGTPHSLHFIEGTGTVVAILQSGEYVGTDVDAAHQTPEKGINA